MLDSFESYMKDYPIYLYNEEFEPKTHAILQGWNLGNEYEHFQQRWADKRHNQITRFAKKGFSIIHAMENVKAKYLIWCDADCVLKSSIPGEVLDKITGKNILSSHYNVYHIHNQKEYRSCETGFFILNTQHSEYNKFVETYKDIYFNDKTENIRRFFDGEVYGEVLNQLDPDLEYNLNVSKKYKTPIPRSLLGPYLSHYKGKGLKSRVFKKETK